MASEPFAKPVTCSIAFEAGVRRAEDVGWLSWMCLRSRQGDLFVYSSAELELGPLFAGMRDRHADLGYTLLSALVEPILHVPPGKLSAMGMIRAGVAAPDKVVSLLLSFVLEHVETC